MMPLRQMRKFLPLALLLSSALAVQAQTNQLNTTRPSEISAGTSGLYLEIDGTFPINSGHQTPLCFYTGFGASGTPLSNVLTGDQKSPEDVEIQIPASSIQQIPASSFASGVFNALVYATQNTTDTCTGTFNSSYTNSRQIPIQLPDVLSTDLDSLSARNISLSPMLSPPHYIYLQGTDFVVGQATVTFSGPTFDPIGGTVTVLSSISARVTVPSLPPAATSATLTYCTSSNACAAPLIFPINPLASNPGTLTATPSPTTPTTSTGLQAVFGSANGPGVPTGMVTFTDGGANLGTAPLTLTTGQFVPSANAANAGDIEGYPQSIVTDLNHDGSQDVILYTPESTQIFYAADNVGGLGFNSSGGNFQGVQFPRDPNYCDFIVGITTADFNNDGYPDIAVLCTNPSDGDQTDNVLVYLNQGDGTFAQESAIFAAPSARLITAADFNKDGAIDILLAGPDGNMDPNGSPLGGFNIYTGNGDGTFNPSTPIDAPLADGYQIAAVDFNNDGYPDIAILYNDFYSDLSASPIVVFQNDGAGRFPSTPVYNQQLGDTGATDQFFVRYLPGAEFPDLVAINTDGAGASISEVFNNKTPTIGFSDTIYTAPVPGMTMAAMGDFNGDGFQDILAYDGANLSVYNSDSTGQYNQPLASFTMAASVTALLGVSDTNADGYSDPIALITGNGSQVQQYITSGTATASLPGLTFAAGSHSLSATTPGTFTLKSGTATATLVSNSTLQPVSGTNLTASPTSPTPYGPSKMITLTAEVDSAASPAPTGTVQVINSSTNAVLGTITLTPVSATESTGTLSIGPLTVGNYQFGATYSGDTVYASAPFLTASYQITKAAPTVTFAPNPSTINYGTALSTAQLDATATLGGVTVAGTFVYTNASGTVVNTSTILPAGPNSITVTFTPTDTTDYSSPTSVTQTITVNKVTPTITFVPNPASIPFGTALSTAQLDASAIFSGNTVAGTFVYTNASGTVVNTSTILPIGPNTITLNFTPTDTTDYNTPAAVPATITVTKATPGITLAVTPTTPTTYSPTGSQAFTATVTVNSTTGATGTVQFFDGANSIASINLVVGTSGSTTTSTATYTSSTPFQAGTHSITAVYSGDNNYGTVTSAITSYVVNKATPTIAYTPTPTTFTYGATLTANQLNATAKIGATTVAGTFVYTVSSAVVTTSTVLSSGVHTITATFTPTDTTDYVSGGNASSSLTVFQASATLAFSPTPLSITYGTPLVATQLDATATSNGNTVAGTFQYISGGLVVTTATVFTAGSHTLGANFTPTDTTDYVTGFVAASSPITVTQATPTITYTPNPATIAFGTQLTFAQLNATASLNGAAVAGTFVYTNASGTVVSTTTFLPTGPNQITATFTPSDTTDYASGAHATSTVTVSKATPTIAFVPNPSTITFGPPLSTAQLDATASFNGNTVAGTFVYQTGVSVVNTTTVLAVGMTSVTAIFTPTDTTDYVSGGTASATITVNKATPALIFVPNPASIPYGTALSAAQLDATATSNGSNVPGTFGYATGGSPISIGTVLAAGAHVITTNFQPSDSNDFVTGGTTTATVTVTQATPVITFAPNPAIIPYGTALSSAQLDATATVNGSPIAGTFAYTTTAGTVTTGTVLAAGVYTIRATFTPADATDYASGIFGTATVTIEQGIPVIAFTPNPASIASGTPLSAAQLDATATFNANTVAGTFAYTSGGATVSVGTLLPVGPHVITATFSPTDTTDYMPGGSAQATVTVAQSTPVITFVPNPASIGFGTGLTAAQLDATATFNGNAVAGTFVYTNASSATVTVGTVLPLGPNVITAAFTPSDTTTYAIPATVNATITVTASTFTAPNTPVNSTSATQTAQVAFTTSGTLGAINVLTQGAINSDYNFVSGGTCAIGTAYTSGQVCSVMYSFTPTVPGIGLGGITLTLNNSAGALLGGSYLAGTGTGPQITFLESPAPAILNSGFSNAFGVAEDGSGDIFVSDTGTGTVKQLFLENNYTTGTTIGSGFAAPNGLAVDGFGNVFVADAGTAKVSELLAAGGYTTVVPVGSGFSSPTAVAVDGAGNLYVSDVTSSTVREFTAASGYTAATTLGSGFSKPTGIAVDGSNNVFVADFGNNAVKEITAASGYTTVNTLGSGFTAPNAVTVDAAGNVFVAGTSIQEILALGGYTTVNTLVGATSASGITSDGRGNIFYTGGANLDELNFLNPSALTFASTAFGGSSVAQSVTVANDGNTTLTFTGLASSNNNFSLSGSTCTATGTLAAGTSCTLAIEFTPQSVGPLTGNILLTDNTHNVPGKEENISLSGVGVDAIKTITFPQPATPVALNSTAILAATASNGDPVTYTVISGAATISGATITYTQAGPITIAANSAATADYAAAMPVTRTVQVQQATPTIIWTTPATIPYGTALSATQLDATATFNGATIAGTFVYNPTSGTVLTAGSHALGVTFTPTDTADYATATGSTTIAVGQATPVITWTPPAPITLGTALSATQLNATASVSGTFVYTPALGAFPPIGPNTLGVTFTPTDTTDYTTASTSVPLTVNPAVTTTTVASSANPSQFGQTVTFTVAVTSAYTGAAITGTVSVLDGATLLGTVQLPNLTVTTATLTAGAHSITAVYNGSTNFAGDTSAILTETINSATTTITWPQPASVPYGTKLSATQLNATVATAFAQTVPGAFVYTPAAGAILTAGSQTLSVVFTPTDTTSFKTATTTVTLVVTKVSPTLAWAAPADITAGTPLSATQLNATATDIAGATLPGVFTYTPASGAILGPGPTTLSAAFVPTDTVDYNSASITTPLTVDPAAATAAVTSSANPSQFGQPILFTINITSGYTASPINGTVTISDGQTVLGTPTLTNGVATFSTSTLAAGAHSITAHFAGNSTFAAITSPILTQTINVATTTITWPTPAGISYGTALSATQLDATVATPYATTVPGAFTYTPPTGTILAAGSQTLSVTFTPTDTTDFKPATASVTIAVGKTAPTITWPTPASITAGTALSAAQLNATAAGISGALPGSFVYTPALGTVLTPGTQTLSVTFTPTDLTDYTTATTTVPLNVIGLALTSLSATTAKLGDPALTLTLTGAGFVANSAVNLNGAAIATTFVNATTLTAIVPATNFLTATILQVTVTDPTQSLTSNALTITVGAPAAPVGISGPTTVTPTSQPNLTFSLATGYPVPVTVTLTLTFTPAVGLPADGSITFPNGTTTTTFTIPANTTTIPAVPFQSGSTAGTITITMTLTAGGVNVTPTPAPTLVIVSPEVTPGVSSVTLARSGDTLTVTVTGYSNTREMQQAHFHFIAAPGASLATSDLVIDGTTLFNAWYSQPVSQATGSSFTYTQLFNLSQDASVVGQVQVTLTNTLGDSQTVSSQ